MRETNGKLWAHDGKFEIRSLTMDNLQEALDVLDKSFFLNESVCNACEINLKENHNARLELRELCEITANDGVSLVAKHIPSGKVAAVSFNKVQCLPEAGEENFFLKFRKEHVQSPQAQRLMDFMIEVDAEIDVCELFKMNCFVELMFLATLPEFERNGLGRALAKCTKQLTHDYSKGIGLDDIKAEFRSKRPAAVTALWTSQFSQKIGKAEDFKVLNAVPYTRFSYGGKTFDQRINPLHKVCEHVAYVL